MTPTPNNPLRLVRIFSGIGLLHSLLFLGFWLTNSAFYTTTNEYLVKLTGANLDYISICLVMAVLVFGWSAAPLVWSGGGRMGDWLYAAIGALFIVFFYGSFWLLFSKSPVQMVRLQQMLSYYRIGIDWLILSGAAISLGLWVRGSGRNGWKALLPAFILYAIIWVIPLFSPPISVSSGQPPEKPKIIAHRGASMLAPENTLAAMNLAVELGAYGVESDLHLSLDGVPFLMHDDSLARTTDVAAVFPGREKERAESFTLAEVEALNAGKWFGESDPFGVIANDLASPAQIETYNTQQVPTLADLLDVVRQGKVVLIFDMKQPPEKHPFRDLFFPVIFEQIRAAQIDAQIWFLTSPEQAQVVRTQAPAMTLVYGADYDNPPPPESLVSSGYKIVNAEFGLSPAWIQRYQAAGLRVNLYTVDEAWQFKYLWLLGVNSITSSNAGQMLTLQRPDLFPLPVYWLIWIILGGAEAGLIWILGGARGRVG